MEEAEAENARLKERVAKLENAVKEARPYINESFLSHLSAMEGADGHDFYIHDAHCAILKNWLAGDPPEEPK